MFGLIKSPKYTGNCRCEDLKGNKGIIINLSPGLAAAMMGWDVYCIVKDYDELAKDEMAKEAQDDMPKM